nr:uncharacterized protein LOC123768007 [Procambarus clarkii]
MAETLHIKYKVLLLFLILEFCSHSIRDSQAPGSGRENFSDDFTSPLEPELSSTPYSSAYMTEYPSHQPALGRSPRGSVSPPRHQYNTSPLRTPRGYTSPLRTPRGSTSPSTLPQEVRSRRNSDSPPRHNSYPSERRSPRGGRESPLRAGEGYPLNNQDTGSPDYQYSDKKTRRPRVSVPRPSKIKRYLLTRDPKDRRISGNGLGMKVVGGKEIPGTRGRLGAYIVRLHPGGVADVMGQLKEGDLILEWNGVTLIDRTYEEVQAIVAQSVDDAEVEIVVRSDINMITGERLKPPSSSSRSGSNAHSSHTYPSPSFHSPRRRPDFPTDDPLDINGNRSTFDGLVVNTTRNSSQENLSMNENRFTESDGGLTGGKSEDSSLTDSPRARSTSRPRPQGNNSSSSPSDTRGTSQISPGIERPTTRHSSRDGVHSASSASIITHGGIPLRSHSSPERRCSNGAGTSGGGGSHVLEEEVRGGGGGVAVSSPPQHPNLSNRRRSNSRNNVKESGVAASKGVPAAQMGEVLLQVCYDSRACILYVTVIQARSIYTLRDDGDTRPDPFVKVYLLPGRSVENQRRTRYLTRTSRPEWNQTMVYPNLRPADLSKRYLEVTAWNYQANKPNEFLGEIVLNLSESTLLDEKSRWYQLQEPDREDLEEPIPD